MSTYRIEYSVQVCNNEDDAFEEIGFGSSGAWNDVDQAMHMAASAVANREWETYPHQPDPSEVDA